MVINLCRDDEKYRRRQFEVPVDGTGESARGKISTHFQQKGCDDSELSGPAFEKVVVSGDVSAFWTLVDPDSAKHDSLTALWYQLEHTVLPNHSDIP